MLPRQFVHKLFVFCEVKFPRNNSAKMSKRALSNSDDDERPTKKQKKTHDPITNTKTASKAKEEEKDMSEEEDEDDDDSYERSSEEEEPRAQNFFSAFEPNQSSTESTQAILKALKEVTAMTSEGISGTKFSVN